MLTFCLALRPLATEYHLGLLKAKLAKYRAQLLEPSKSASSKGEGFDVMKSGDARVALIGFPSVGKVSDGRCGPRGGSSLSPEHDCAPPCAAFLNSLQGPRRPSLPLDQVPSPLSTHTVTIVSYLRSGPDPSVAHRRVLSGHVCRAPPGAGNVIGKEPTQRSPS